MSRVKERLKQYKLDLEKQTQYKQGLPGSALDIVNTLLADLEEDEKKKRLDSSKRKTFRVWAVFGYFQAE